MAFAYLYESNFAAGTTAEWTSEVDTESKLNIKGYPQLSRQIPSIVPYSSNYSAEVDLSLGTAAAYLQEDTGFDTAATTIHIGFDFYATGLVMAASDRFTIFRLESVAATTSEGEINIRNNAGVIEILAAETGSASTLRAIPLEQDKWHYVELSVLCNAGAGTIDFYLDDVQVGAQITTLTTATIVDASFGAIGVDAGTTAGLLYFGPFFADDARVRQISNRFPTQKNFTKTGQYFVGPGHISTAALLSTTAGNTMKIYDTDLGDSNASETSVAELAVGAHTAISGPLRFNKGCYVVLAGTSPRGQVILTTGLESSGMAKGPRYYSDAGIKRWGLRR